MKTIFVLLLLTFTTLTAFCEKDTIFYYTKLGKVTDAKSNPQSYDQVKKMTDSVFYLEHYNKKADKWVHDVDDKKLIMKNDSTYLYFGKVTAKTDTIYRHVKRLKSGYIIKDYQDKILIETGFSKMIVPLIKEGKWTNYYFSTAMIKSEEEYKDNQMTGNKRWNESYMEDIADVFPRAEVDPEFQGGAKKLTAFMAKNIKYPGKSDRQGELGTVTVQFIVMEDGTINGVEILKSVTKSLDAESIRIIKAMPAWTPGTIDGKKVRVLMHIPIQFILPKA
jgi:TonB family protein